MQSGLVRKRRSRLRLRHFPAKNQFEDAPHARGMAPMGRFEGPRAGEPHQARQAMAGRQRIGNGVGLAIVLHLEAMFEVA